MTKPKKHRSPTLLTDTELELMQILWRLGQGSVNDVLQALPPERELAYTSVSTILRILEQKGTLSSQKAGRSHIYIPNVSKAEVEAASLHNLVEKVFEGAPSRAVQKLLSTEDLTPADLEELKAMIEKRLS